MLLTDRSEPIYAFNMWLIPILYIWKRSCVWYMKRNPHRPIAYWQMVFLTKTFSEQIVLLCFSVALKNSIRFGPTEWIVTTSVNQQIVLNQNESSLLSNGNEPNITWTNYILLGSERLKGKLVCTNRTDLKRWEGA